MQEALSDEAIADEVEPRTGFLSSFDEDQIALRRASTSPGAALCTIVGIDGSFSRRLGGQLAIDVDGTTHGSLSDGCLEKELAAQTLSLKILGDGPATLRFGKGSPFIDFRLPCGSGLDLLLDPDPDTTAIRTAVSALDDRCPASLRLATTRPDLLTERFFIPSLRLVICGAGPEAEWLQRLATSMGVATQLVGPDRGLYLGRAPSGIRLDRWTAVALLFHDHEWERSILEWALASDAFYVGAMGGQRARETRAAALGLSGFDDEMIARVRSPVGLIKKARDARLLALSVLSDIAQDYECQRIPAC